MTKPSTYTRTSIYSSDNTTGTLVSVSDEDTKGRIAGLL